jgi:hypothetical protein
MARQVFLRAIFVFHRIIPPPQTFLNLLLQKSLTIMMSKLRNWIASPNGVRKIMNVYGPYAGGDKMLPQWDVNIFDEEGELVARVNKVLYVRKKR